MKEIFKIFKVDKPEIQTVVRGIFRILAKWSYNTTIPEVDQPTSSSLLIEMKRLVLLCTVGVFTRAVAPKGLLRDMDMLGIAGFYRNLYKQATSDSIDKNLERELRQFLTKVYPHEVKLLYAFVRAGGVRDGINVNLLLKSIVKVNGNSLYDKEEDSMDEVVQRIMHLAGLDTNESKK